MAETRRYPLLTPAVRRRVVRAVARHAYEEWRLGRFHCGKEEPMWHELPPEGQQRQENFARRALDIYEAFPTKAKSARKSQRSKS